MVQAWFLNLVISQLTGFEQGDTVINMVNCHIYQNQEQLVLEQVKRVPYNPPKFIVKKQLTLKDLMEDITKENFDEYFEVQDYIHHPPIKYPFTI